MDRTFYDVLQVSPTADSAVIEAAYRGLIGKYQPLAATDPEAAKRLDEVQRAYGALGDPASRSEYDLDLAGRATATRIEQVHQTVDPGAEQPVSSLRQNLPIWLLVLLGLCGLLAAVAVCGALGLFAVFGPARAVVATGTPARVLPTQPSTTAPRATSTPSTGFSSGSGFVTTVVMAEDTRGDNFEPVGLVDTFTQSQKMFHAVVTVQDAPTNSTVGATWYKDGINNSSPNQKIGEYSLTTEGSRNLDFTFKPTELMPAGNFHVDIVANGKIVKTLRFQVQAGGANTIIQSATLARSVKGENKDPVDPTTNFAPGDKVLHLVIALQNAPDKTEFKAIWYFGTQLIDSTTLTTGGTRNVDFNLTQNQPWPAGPYHVDIFVNGAQDRTVEFQVK